jgi:hypothetical protein
MNTNTTPQSNRDWAAEHDAICAECGHIYPETMTDCSCCAAVTTQEAPMNERTITIIVAPANATDYTQVQPCGCCLDGRCDTHTAMMQAIHAVYCGENVKRFQRVGALADGFGIAGYNIGDWSAWRDSSIPAIEAMYAEAIR